MSSSPTDQLPVSRASQSVSWALALVGLILLIVYGVQVHHDYAHPPHDTRAIGAALFFLSLYWNGLWLVVSIACFGAAGALEAANAPSPNANDSTARTDSSLED